MNKWFFAAGIFVCSLLFFASGFLGGYSVGSKISPASEEETKAFRSPSKEAVEASSSDVKSSRADRVTTRFTDQAKMNITSKYGIQNRIPTTPAAQKAKSFINMLR